jgi:hypothetical protein
MASGPELSRPAARYDIVIPFTWALCWEIAVEASVLLGLLMGEP